MPMFPVPEEKKRERKVSDLLLLFSLWEVKPMLRACVYISATEKYTMYSGCHKTLSKYGVQVL